MSIERNGHRNNSPAGDIASLADEGMSFFTPVHLSSGMDSEAYNRVHLSRQSRFGNHRYKIGAEELEASEENQLLISPESFRLLNNVYNANRELSRDFKGDREGGIAVQWARRNRIPIMTLGDQAVQGMNFVVNSNRTMIRSVCEILKAANFINTKSIITEERFIDSIDESLATIWSRKIFKNLPGGYDFYRGKSNENFISLVPCAFGAYLIKLSYFAIAHHMILAVLSIEWNDFKKFPLDQRTSIETLYSSAKPGSENFPEWEKSARDARHDYLVWFNTIKSSEENGRWQSTIIRIAENIQHIFHSIVKYPGNAPAFYLERPAS